MNLFPLSAFDVAVLGFIILTAISVFQSLTLRNVLLLLEDIRFRLTQLEASKPSAKTRELG